MKQVTIKDIAEIAGVSFSTVSRCLNDSSLVSDKTKSKVNKIADDLGFEFNAGARSMITSRAGTVGIIMPEQYKESNVNVYHSMLMNKLRTSLEKADMDLIVSHQQNHYSGQNNIIRLVTRNKVDGLIILLEDLSEESCEFLEKKSVPFVCIHYPPGKVVQDQDVVYTDHYMGGRLVAEHLLKKGNQTFVLIAEEEKHLEYRQREDGFCDTIEKAGFTVNRYYSDSSFDAARAVVSSNIEEIKEYDALFGSNDLMALGAMQAMRDAGMIMPADMSVVGYDDTEFCLYNNPGLTSIHQPREELAHISCDRLFMQIEKMKNGEQLLKKRISIQPVLVPRESS
ncbi:MULTISPECIES: LacI family DNA-binding transcriptional regulator [unclassified Oceanispirochaeta]|uniref:LacI family DNA-binding transcriptional regulator n=1 Tax=unclassified Oceanispirochaeta TaxID=2635722 RepID=UPI000E08EA27|nr:MULTISPECIES: LacI family DNA-binding transcriptional regulator [unclassified Oceanispirochaeta]MBF9016717.1 LacI family DNA-binding transcriptional regulator [Oceanispirochaeta sp. M2]NPD73078.1 LacI family transcriptional regulator [Oceanispirochaeta sp. M1]RDG31182.1 LacI family transcriptional regulator [Oceanispirochaeta sp. M1]